MACVGGPCVSIGPCLARFIPRYFQEGGQGEAVGLTFSVPAPGFSSSSEALAGKTGCSPGGQLKTLCLEGPQRVFLSPHLTLAIQSSPVCGLWGGCTGAAYRSDWKEKEEEEKYLQIAELQIHRWFLKTQEHERTQANPEAAARVRHGDTETHLCVQRHMCTQIHMHRHRDSSQQPA